MAQPELAPCPRCSYQLQPTQMRCPECGWTRPVAPLQSGGRRRRLAQLHELGPSFSWPLAVRFGVGGGLLLGAILLGALLSIDPLAALGFSLAVPEALSRALPMMAMPVAAYLATGPILAEGVPGSISPDQWITKVARWGPLAWWALGATVALAPVAPGLEFAEVPLGLLAVAATAANLWWQATLGDWINDDVPNRVWQTWVGIALLAAALFVLGNVMGIRLGLISIAPTRLLLVATILAQAVSTCMLAADFINSVLHSYEFLAREERRAARAREGPGRTLPPRLPR